MTLRFACAAPVLLAVPLLAIPPSACAADVEGTSRIDAVTVYADRAQVTRVVRAQVPSGSNRVILSDLPVAVMRASLRSRGGGEDWQLGRVALTEREKAELVEERERELTQEIEALQSQQRIREDRIKAQRIKLDFIGRLGESTAAQINDRVDAGAIDPDTWERGWAKLVSGSGEALDAIRLAEEDLAQLARRADRARRELHQLATGARAVLEAAVDVQADRATEVTFELTYQVTGASWQPQYDARLASEGRTVTVTQYGSVSQGTGEAWDNVLLAFSTTAPGRGELAELQPWRVDIARPVQPSVVMSRSQFGKSEAQDMAGNLAMSDDVTAGSAPAPVMATAEVSEFAASYNVEGRVSVPSDRSQHEMVIGRGEVPVELRAEAVPKFDRHAYLVARLTQPGGAPWPAGMITLFRDDALVGTGRLDAMQPGETRDLSFGLDDAIAIDYRLDTGARSSEGIINSYQREERRYLIDATNHHRTAIELTILDQMPVPQDEDITVEMLDDTTPPTTVDRDRKRGVMAWTETLQPGASMDLRFGYAITWPKGERLEGF